MDYIRLSLIAALAIVSYLLLLAWNEDYPAQPRQAADNEVVSQENAGTDLPSSIPSPEDSSSGGVADSGESTQSRDIPRVSEDTPEPSPEPENTSDSLISITTPVQEVTIDRRGGDIVELRLPEYPISLETPDDPFVLMQNNSNLVYVAQNGLIGRDGPDGGPDGRPLYQAGQDSYTLVEGEETLTVELTHITDRGVRIIKRFTFSTDDYLIDVDYVVENNSESPWRGNLFGQIKRDGSPDPSTTSGLGVNTYLGAALTTDDDPYKKVDFGDIDDGGTTDEVMGGWIAFSQHYFVGGWIPSPDRTHTYTTRKNSAGQYIMGFVSPATTVQPGESRTISASYWAGPKDQFRLEEISPNLGLTIDYGWLWFIAHPIFWLLIQINNLIGNFGWSIIALTLVIKAAFMKLSASAYRSMAKMRRLAPQLAQLKERYSDDKQKLMQAQMDLWKKEKVNPMGGCLPMLLQMPVLIGIYWVLNKSVELRHADWILWYNDLSVMDPYFLLPLIMGASMYISQLMTPMTMADPMQAKIMKFMPLIFTVFFLWFPAGLVLYWLVSNIFNIVQQWYINKKVEESYRPKAG